MIVIHGETPSKAYLKALEQVLDKPEYLCAPRDLKIREVLNLVVEVDHPNSSPLTTLDSARNKVLVDYTRAEMELYLSGERRVEKWAEASKFWNRIANPDGTVNSAYGWLIFYDKSCGNPEYEIQTPGAAETVELMRTPWEWAREAIVRDHDTRQAILPFIKRDHLWLGCRDVTCTVYGSFMLRDGRLNLTISMRSNDLVRGLGFDLPFFNYLHLKMVEELSTKFPVEVGTYTHIANSAHIYDRDVASALRMIGR